MKKHSLKSIGLAIIVLLFACSNKKGSQNDIYDVIVYGGTSSGVIAAYTAWKQGNKVLLIEPGNHLGGLSSGGLGQTDIGNKYAVQGLARKFYRDLGRYYGVFEAWKFEPHAAEQIFDSIVASSGITLIRGYRLHEITKKEGRIQTLIAESSLDPSETRSFSGTIFIDCSYEGDLMAKSGISYIVGRESNTTYGENFNGFQLMDKHQFPDHIDPYIVPGMPSSGLLYGVSPDLPVETGTGDHRVQAYNFRLCMTRDTSNMIPLTRPEDYDPARYELLRRVIRQRDSLGWIQRLHQLYLKIDMMPNGKTDINNKGPQSTDFIGENYNYPEADYQERDRIERLHESYIKGLLYFLSHDQDVTEELRLQMLEWGWAADEFIDNGGFPHQMYIREARRMIGEYVMTEHNCIGDSLVNDGIALAAYTMDSHNCQRIVVNGMVKNEGDVQVGRFPTYEISYRSLVPRQQECENLLVPVCLSASHIAFGSIRMEPVFMVLGQVAGLAADLALKQDIPVQEVDHQIIKNIFKEDPYLDDSPADIIIDNANSGNFSSKGEWEITNRWMGQYQNDYILNMHPDPSASATFKFKVGKEGNYDIFLYVPLKPALRTNDDWNWERKVPVSVKYASNNHHMELDFSQHEKDWVHAGAYHFQEASEGVLIIEGTERMNPIAADACLLVYQHIKNE